ncbi:OLC1v1005201C1 [Oldenlandia corymbosa var. corymbosa]|uniref:OLC1v1005201C1 n=1 Tax=Oldenlandia corymbosa var. corymbosa TaxID=529605 RepID=A0AAV1DE25_OLDCO|nr:OLC1v1005201C1 [Oldenlandia corymbosa var. corymbosa]
MAYGLDLQSDVRMHKSYMWGYRDKEMRIGTPINSTDAQTVHVGLQSRRHEDCTSNRLLKHMRIVTPIGCTDAKTVHMVLER